MADSLDILDIVEVVDLRGKTDDNELVIGEEINVPNPDDNDKLDILIGEEMDITPISNSNSDDIIVGEGVDVPNPDDELDIYPQKKSFWDRVLGRK